jgi:hypothetical protein
MQNRLCSHHPTLEIVKAAAQCSRIALGRVFASGRLGCGLRILDRLLVVLQLADVLGLEDEGLDDALDSVAVRAIFDRSARREDEVVDGLPGSTVESVSAP